MVQITFSPLFDRPTYALPEMRCFNVYSEPTPFGKTFLPRPALIRRNEPGTGPIRGLFREPGVDGAAVFIVSGRELYRLNGLIGTVAGEEPVRWAASSTQLVVVGGGSAYTYDTTTHAYARVDDPDLPPVDDVEYLGGRFYYKQKDSDVFWFSALEDARDIDGLAFETADGAPDDTVGIAERGGQLAFFGQSTLQYFDSTGDANAPLASALGQTYNYGCASQASIVKMDNALFFVGSDAIVYRSDGGVPQRVSTYGIEEKLRGVTDPAATTAFTQFVDGHLLYIMSNPDMGTFVFDQATREWSEWGSYGEPQLRISCGIMYQGQSWLGDYATNQVWRFSPGGLRDYNEPIEHEVSAYAPLEGGSARCDVVSLQCVRGVGTGGQSTDPQIEMSYSDDAGRTYSPWQPRPLGQQGRYRDKAVWHRLRLMRSPGRIFKFRYSAPVVVALESMTVGDQRP